MFGRNPVISEWTLDVAADVAATWAVFSDTDRFNRAAGLNFSFDTRTGEDGKAVAVGSMQRLGMTHTWDEQPWTFEAPHWFRAERVFHGGPAARVEIELRLTPGGRGTQVSYRVSVHPRSAAMRPIVMADAAVSTRPQLNAALKAAAQTAEGDQGGYDPTPPPLGDAAEARLVAGLSQVASPQVAETIGAIVRHAPLFRQGRIHPTAVARRLGIPDNEVINGFLAATRAGALELRWELTCPSCRAPKAQLEVLSAAPKAVHCDSCDVRYDGTFPDSVVVSFRPAPSVRAFEVPVQCLLSPQRTPHVLVQRTLAARDIDDLEVTLEAGAYLLELGDITVPVEISDKAASDVATIIVDADGCAPLQLQARPGQVRLILRSRRRDAVPVVLKHRRRVRPRLSLGQLLAVPGALELLPAGAVAPGLRTDVAWGAVLAVDELLGRGARLVAVASMVAELNPLSLRRDGGTLVATWADAGQALKAAQWLVGDLRLSVGVDHGPVVTVTEGVHQIPCGGPVDGALDAARLMGAGRVAVATPVAEHPQAAAHLAPSAQFVDAGHPHLRLLRDLTARDRYVEALIAATPSAPLDVLGGRYRILRELGQGGQGAVYLVHDQETGVERVAKVLLADVMSRPRLVQFFVDEARIAATLDHPAIPTVLDAGVAPGERLWMVMERVVGRTLTDVLEQAGTLAPAEVVRISLALLDALAVVHAAGLVHRDMKPDNVMVGPDGRVHLLDLGIARLALDDDDPTLEGNILGTPLYLAPEQLVPPYTVDGRADLYALGLVMHTLLSGSPPFAGKTRLAIAMARLKVNPPDLTSMRADLPPGLVAVVDRVLNRDRQLRFADAAQMAAALAEV